MLFQLPLEAILLLVPVLLFSLCFHEFAHAAAAKALGDDTAERAGRLTLNPAAHLDLFGTIFLLIAGFGYAKPVPINIRNLKRPRRDDTLIALAGPGANLVLAVIAGIGLRLAIPRFDSIEGLTGGLTMDLFRMGFYAMSINLSLAMFNILPIYPLDGSHVVENSLPIEQSMRFRETARYSIFFFLAIMLFPVVRSVIFAPAHWLARILVGYDL